MKETEREREGGGGEDKGANIYLSPKRFWFQLCYPKKKKKE